MSTGTQIWRFDNSNGQTVLLYDTGNPNTTVAHLAADGTDLFFFEVFRSCAGFVCQETATLKRRGRGTTGGADALLIRPPDISFPVRQLRHDGDYLFWREASGQIIRFPKNAAALPVVNLRVTGLRVVQSVQDQNNSVALVERKRTFVRLLVRSDGPAVPNVQAQLTRANDPQKLLPINDAGPRITVLPSPVISATEQAFLFELPWAWTTGQSDLIATLNPYRVPLEPDYGDNTAQVNVSFLPSPLLSVEFFSLNYTLGGTFYAPRLREDVLATYSWLLRAYPLGGALGQNFRPRLWPISGGDQLGAWVENSTAACDLIGIADRQLCAAFYTNGWLQEIRDEGRIPNTTGFYYGMISDAAGPFPSGLAFGGTNNSVGPVGNPANRPNMRWGTDTTFGDWYAGHEIAHTLGRNHPSQGNWCRHSASDPAYPFAGARIGPGPGSVEGFDAGAPAFGSRPMLLPDNLWTDMMGYCQNQWVSAYTYSAIWTYMILHPSAASTGAAAFQARQPGPRSSPAPTPSDSAPPAARSWPTTRSPRPPRTTATRSASTRSCRWPRARGPSRSCVWATTASWQAAPSARVHEPHMPMPQPNLVPVSPSSSRSTHSKMRSGSSVTVDLIVDGKLHVDSLDQKTVVTHLRSCVFVLGLSLSGESRGKPPIGVMQYSTVGGGKLTLDLANPLTRPSFGAIIRAPHYATAHRCPHRTPSRPCSSPKEALHGT